MMMIDGWTSHSYSQRRFMRSRPFAGSWLCTTASVCHLFEMRIGEWKLVIVEGEEKGEHGGLVETEYAPS